MAHLRRLDELPKVIEGLHRLSSVATCTLLGRPLTAPATSNIHRNAPCLVKGQHPAMLACSGVSRVRNQQRHHWTIEIGASCQSLII
jgi:hypothetical protein